MITIDSLSQFMSMESNTLTSPALQFRDPIESLQVINNLESSRPVPQGGFEGFPYFKLEILFLLENDLFNCNLCSNIHYMPSMASTS